MCLLSLSLSKDGDRVGRVSAVLCFPERLCFFGYVNGSQHPYVCTYLSVSLGMSMAVNTLMCVRISLFLWICQWQSTPLCVYVSLCFFGYVNGSQHPYVCTYLSVSLDMSMAVNTLMCVHISLFLWICQWQSTPLCVYIFWTLCRSVIFFFIFLRLQRLFVFSLLYSPLRGVSAADSHCESSRANPLC